jgi:hypothetical protein
VKDLRRHPKGDEKIMSINLEISRRQFLKSAGALVIAPLSGALELK